VDAEIEAFLTKFNYFLQEPRVWIKAINDWRNAEYPASEKQLRNALDDLTPFSLRASYATSFIGVDIDLIGKDEAKSEEKFVKLRTSSNPGPTTTTGLFAETLLVSLTSSPAVGPELAEAISIVKSSFLVPPSLLVRTPHGVHLYWCFSETVSWQTQIKLVEYLLETIVHAKMEESRVQRKIEVLPSPSRSLRIPSRARALDQSTLDWDRKSPEGADFWLSLPLYRWEELLDRQALLKKRRTIDRERKRLAALVQGMGEISKTVEAPVASFDLNSIVFSEGESDANLKRLVRGAKAQGLSEEGTLALVKDRLATLVDQGYEPEADMRGAHLERRVLHLHRTARGNVDSKKNRYQAIWDLPVEVTVRDDWVTWALTRLKDHGLLPPEASEGRVVRFLQDLDRWMLKVDHAVDGGGDSDTTLVRAVGRSSYPFPKFLLTGWYSRYAPLWKALQVTEVLAKDPLVGYVPDLHRPQFYLRTPPGSPAG